MRHHNQGHGGSTVNLRNIGVINRTLRKVRRLTLPLYSFLNKVPGVVHVGANVGQERELYASHDLNMHRVEPIPDVFEQLRANIAGYPRQRAYARLLAETSGVEHALHVVNNGGASSSILDFNFHKEVWPEVEYTHDIVVKATTLADLCATQGVNSSDY
jgi:FkbM family methyltransferase